MSIHNSCRLREMSMVIRVMVLMMAMTAVVAQQKTVVVAQQKTGVAAQRNPDGLQQESGKGQLTPENCFACQPRLCETNGGRCQLLCSVACPDGYRGNKKYTNCRVLKPTTLASTIITTTITNTNNKTTEPQIIDQLRKTDISGSPQNLNTVTPIVTQDNKLNYPQYRVCTPCQDDKCLTCRSSSKTCQKCLDGFKLAKGICEVEVDQAGDDRSGFDDLAFLAVGAAIVVVVVVVGVVVYVMKRKRRSLEVSGGCSIDLITTERIPSSVRNSQSQLNGITITTDYVTAAISQTIGKNQEAGHDKQSQQPSREMQEISDLPEAPSPPRQDAEQSHDYLGFKSPDTPVASLGEKNYSKANVYENVMPPIKNSKSKKKHQSRDEGKHLCQPAFQDDSNSDLYVNTAQINNIIQNKNCSIELMRPLGKPMTSSPPDHCSCTEVVVDDESTSGEVTAQDYVLIPPPYDTISTGSGQISSRTERTHGLKNSPKEQNDYVNSPASFGERKAMPRSSCGKTGYLGGDGRGHGSDDMYVEADGGVAIYADDVYSQPKGDAMLYTAPVSHFKPTK